jgi:hypothetical protein
MQFHAISIFLHRPLFSQTRRASSQLSFDSSTLARRACITSAKFIVQLLQIYRRQHTLRRSNVQLVHIVFSAGLILVYNTCTSVGIEAERAMADLQVCCQALNEIGQAWKNSSRALEVIICIKRDWQSKAMKRQIGKRAISRSDEQRKKRAVDIGLTEHGSLLPIDSASSGVPYAFQGTWDLVDGAGLDFNIDTEVLGAGLATFDPYSGGAFGFGGLGTNDTTARNGSSLG